MMNWMRGVLVLLTVLLAVTLTGCVDFLTNIGDGRMQAWKEVRVEEEKTNQEFLKTKSEEFKAKKDTKQNPTLRLTTYDPNGRVTGQAEMDLQPMVAELGLKRESDTYGVPLQRTEQPEGQLEGTVKAVGGTAVQALSAPGTMIYATAKGVTDALEETGGGGNHLTAKEIHVQESFNKTQASNVGSGSAAASSKSGGGASAGEDEMTLEEAFAECTANGEPLGDAMTCVSAKTGRMVDLNGGTVMVDGEPWPLMQTYGQAQIDEQLAGEDEV